MYDILWPFDSYGKAMEHDPSLSPMISQKIFP